MELIKNAMRQLLRKRGRTLLTVGGIAVGVMMVSIVTVIGGMGRAFVDKELDSMGVSGLSVMALSSDALLSKEALLEIRNLPQVTSAMPLSLHVTDVFTPLSSGEAVLCGIDAGAGQVISLTLCHGRMITAGDVAAASPVCVLDETTAMEFFGRKNVVGKTMVVSLGQATEELTVVGVTQAGSSLLQNVATMIPDMVYLPYTTHQNLTGRQDFDQIAVRTTSVDVTGQTERRIKRVLARLYDETSLFRTDNLATQKERLGRIVDVIAAVLTVLGGVSLLVSGFGIVTAMLSSVSERTREIGIKKAIGASHRHILAEFLVEAVVLSMVGAVLGMLPAVVLSILAGEGVSVVTFAGLLLFSLVIGAAFGVYPAYKASKLPPVEALRSE